MLPFVKRLRLIITGNNQVSGDLLVSLPITLEKALHSQVGRAELSQFCQPALDAPVHLAAFALSLKYEMGEDGFFVTAAGRWNLFSLSGGATSPLARLHMVEVGQDLAKLVSRDSHSLCALGMSTLVWLALEDLSIVAVVLFEDVLNYPRSFQDAKSVVNSASVIFNRLELILGEAPFDIDGAILASGTGHSDIARTVAFNRFPQDRIIVGTSHSICHLLVAHRVLGLAHYCNDLA